MKKLKSRINSWLISKVVRTRRENKILKNKIEEFILKEQEYIDAMNILRNEVRGLKLENERLKKDERINPKKK